MATSPIVGYALPNSTSTDQVPTDLMTLVTALEKNVVMSFATAAARDAKITTPVAGMIAFLTSPGKYTYYDGNDLKWEDLSNPNAWDTWTPTLQSPAGTAFSLGTGATQVGRYRLANNGVQFQTTWNFGSSVAGPGGQLVFKLPTGLTGANVTGLQQTGPCSLYIPTLNRSFQGYWTILPGGTIAQPHFPIGTNDCSMDYLRDTTDGQTAGTGVPMVTGTSFNYPIQVNGTMVASGTYQTN